ncbi:hypothetical protein EXIGLDRAFT_727084 [Exidia glandulosa HHB12029]|uniref:Endonuclease/exonuclease/phosphatase domain-containing protein n=1 Tax=Exidia glandulosa HHB12029 TaxID=1314781 RepID=A0A165M4L6_EXIGL|nr:hypothetical protein EXIGLDRAFT_727084 [Exidia glandulosa HHB12029]
MLPKRLPRSLSAFDSSTRRWEAIPLYSAERLLASSSSRLPRAPDVRIDKQTISLVSWNIHAFESRPIARSKLILDHILESPHSPDIILLQEVRSDARNSILNDIRVRSSFLTTDAEDGTAFDDVPFATMTLLSNKRFASDSEGGEKLVVKGVSRLVLPTKYGRDGLCVDIATQAAPETVYRLINVHLDSLNTFPLRALQVETLAAVLREPGCGGGVIAGDFNSTSTEDDELVDKHGLVDAWKALHGSTGLDGATWGVGLEGRKPRRFDKVAMLGLTAEAIEVIRPGLIEIPRPGEPPLHSPWSDHSGLRCTLVI